MRDMVLISNLKAAFEQDSQDSQDFQDYRIRSIPTIVLNAIGLQWSNLQVQSELASWTSGHNPARIPNHNQMQGDWQ